MELLWCNGIPYMYCQLEWGVDVSSVYMHFAICETYLLYHVFHRCIVNWDCGGVDVSSVYVQCAICEWLYGVMVLHRSYCQLEWGGQ